MKIEIEIPEDLEPTMNRETSNPIKYCESYILGMLKRFKKENMLRGLNDLKDLSDDEQLELLDAVQKKKKKIKLDK